MPAAHQPLHSPPLYAQIEDYLRRRLISGELRPGDVLPTEAELCRTFHVSRFTVRQALDRLVREGLLTRQRGRGTTVTRPQLVEHPLSGFYTFAEAVAGTGLPHSSTVLGRTVGPASPEEAEQLALRPDDQVLRLVRLRSVGHEPLLLETSHLPFALCPALLDADLEQQSLYQVLEMRCGILVTRARETIRPALLDRSQADLLGVAPPAAAFHVLRVAYAGDRPVEWRESFIRGDRFAYLVELPRQRTPGREGP